jgi:hypothetical protein
MLGVVDRVCSEGLTMTPGAPPPTVALVVGSAHLPGEHLSRRRRQNGYMWVQSSSWPGGVGEGVTTGLDAGGTTTRSGSDGGLSTPAR